MQAYANSSDDPAFAIQMFLGRKWVEVSPTYANSAANFHRVHAGFFHLTAEAFQYYLPALLVLALDESNSMADGCEPAEWSLQLAQLLDPEPVRLWGDYFKDRFDPLTAQQKKVTAEIIKYIQESNSNLGYPKVSSSCAAYWSQFE